MSVREYILEYITEKRMSRKSLAKKAGIDCGVLQRFLHEEDIMLGNFIKIIEAVDYELAIRPKK